jgi:hypothetical protein
MLIRLASGIEIETDVRHLQDTTRFPFYLRQHQTGVITGKSLDPQRLRVFLPSSVALHV